MSTFIGIILLGLFTFFLVKQVIEIVKIAKAKKAAKIDNSKKEDIK